MFVQQSDSRWLRGEEHIFKYRMPDTQRFGNCRVCGSPVPREVPVANVILIPAGVLDDDPGVRPGFHIFVGSKAPWEQIADGLPQHDEYAPQK